MTGSFDQTPNGDSLNWLAVQYVLGELSESELLAFEDRLETDLAVCEAVDVELADSGTEVAVPDWLFAAVSLEQSNAAGNSTDERQEN